MRLYVLTAIVSLAFSGLSVAQDDVAKEQEKFQGVWKMTSAVDGGQNKSGEFLNKFTFHFKGDQLFPSENVKDVLTFKLELGKTPAVIDLIERETKVQKGIYKFSDEKSSGDTLTLCFTESGDRPTEFTSNAGNKAILIVLKKVETK
jgi:uncharacterized protein (TIGR03067 family)